jgi:hypothetical protein
VKPGDSFELTIANDNNYDPGAASFEVREAGALMLTRYLATSADTGNSSTAFTTRAWSASSSPL